MAIFVANSPRIRCPICDQSFASDEGVRGLSAFMMPEGTDREFTRLSDACVHQACLDQWPRRDEFFLLYNRSVAFSRG